MAEPILIEVPRLQGLAPYRKCSPTDEKPSPVSRGARIRGDWWREANNFTVSNSPMYDMGDNAKVHISDSTYHIKADTVMIGNPATLGMSCVEQRGAQGPEIPSVDQDSLRSRDQEPQITLQPTEIHMARDNEFRDEKRKITPVRPPTLYYLVLSWFLSIYAVLRKKSYVFALSIRPGKKFESEARAEYTNPDSPLDSYTSYPFTSHARTHIYSFEMLTHRVGYPLYMPTPLGGLPAAYRKKGIRIGDVGVITANGGFDFLFNACQPDAGTNPDILPDGFELLKPLIRTSDKFNPGIFLTSDYVRKRSDGNISDFRCLAAEGAVLVLPKGATLYEAVNKHQFERHAARHGVRWYEYSLNEGRDVSNGSLYFVTECIKSVNWGIAVFHAHPIADENLRLILDEGTCRWVPCDKVEARSGPNPKDIIVSEDEEPNQCVFLRGFKISLRPDIWTKLESAKAAVEETRGGSGSEDGAGQVSAVH